MEGEEDLAAKVHRVFEAFGPDALAMARARVRVHLDEGDLDGAALWARAAELLMEVQEKPSAAPQGKGAARRSQQSCRIASAQTPMDGTLEAKNLHTATDRRYCSERNSEIKNIETQFWNIEHMLNQIVAFDSEANDQMLLELHRQWRTACSDAANLPTSTEGGLRAKARMLLAVLPVLAPSTEDRELHEMLAESLARDVLR